MWRDEYIQHQATGAQGGSVILSVKRVATGRLPLDFWPDFSSFCGVKSEIKWTSITLTVTSFEVLFMERQVFNVISQVTEFSFTLHVKRTLAFREHLPIEIEERRIALEISDAVRCWVIKTSNLFTRVKITQRLWINICNLKT